MSEATQSIEPSPSARTVGDFETEIMALILRSMAAVTTNDGMAKLCTAYRDFQVAIIMRKINTMTSPTGIDALMACGRDLYEFCKAEAAKKGAL